MWYLNPKNIILMALAALVIVIGGLYLWQRNTVIKQKGEINALTVANAGLMSQVGEYKMQIVKLKKAQAAQQVIANNTAALISQIGMLKTNCILEKEDEKVINGITNYFNNSGVLPKAGDTSADRKVLPETNSTDLAYSRGLDITGDDKELSQRN
jgi:uncharacterized membrane protein affecting hemolysin expression